MATRDWEAIEVEYITGEISLRQLAERHEVTPTAVKEQAIERDWVDKRDQFRHKTAQTALKQAEISAIDVQREILQSFMEARADWKATKHKRDDYGALARLSASIVGLDTEHGTLNANVADWRAARIAELGEEKGRLYIDKLSAVGEAVASNKSVEEIAGLIAEIEAIAVARKG